MFKIAALPTRASHRHARRSRPSARPKSVCSGIGLLCLVTLCTGFAGKTIAHSPLSAAAARTADSATEHKLKAAFLYNFANYTVFPKGTFAKKDSPLVIAIAGKDPFGKILEAVLSGKKINKHPIFLKRFSDPATVKGANIVFFGEMPKEKHAALLKSLYKTAVLTVGVDSGFTQHGGCSSFYSEKGKLRFEFNVEELKRSKLDVSSQLLKLARIVKDKL
ncbi:MAG: hypothetical protein ACI841_000944 [Planctomycetota bacterium]